MSHATFFSGIYYNFQWDHFCFPRDHCNFGDQGSLVTEIWGSRIRKKGVKNGIIGAKTYLAKTLPWAASGLFIYKCQERGTHSQVQLPLKVSFNPFTDKLLRQFSYPI